MVKYLDRCPNCGGDMTGDGYTSVEHCENVEPDPSLEPDANPVYCNYSDDDAYQNLEYQAACHAYDNGLQP